MVVIVVLVIIVLFSFWAGKFEHNETIKALEREIKQEIEEEIKNGVSVRLSDNRIVSTNNISKNDKKLTKEFQFLISRSYSVSHLESLNFNELKNKFIEEKKKEKEEIAEAIRIKRIKDHQERMRQKEIERQLKEQVEKEKKLKKWNYTKNYCSSISVKNLKGVSGVYLIHSKVTNDYYIGSSINISQRIYQHLYSLNNNKHFSYKMQNDYDLYGVNNFQFFLLNEVSSVRKDNLRTLLEKEEQHYIDLLKPTYNHFMNVKEGKKHHLETNNYY